MMCRLVTSAAAIVLVAFAAWHLLLWRMGEVYRWDQQQ